MNTRLQVEHPITERVVGVDLVKEQIRIAEGMELPFKQEDLKQLGHAIECRICAEDPDNNFMPNSGTITHVTEPEGLGIRCDGYVYSGYTIPLYYDSMLSKLVVWGRTREEAIQRMKRALFEYKITGVKTTIRFLEKIMETPDFVNGKYNTHFIEKNSEFLHGETNCERHCEDIAMIATFAAYLSRFETSKKMNTIPIEKPESNWKRQLRKFTARI